MAGTPLHVVGLGFGPANIAIAGALLEKAAVAAGPDAAKALFIEQHDEFRWHAGMLLPGARMQISFLKDLATLRNPQSPITFVAYLHAHNRLLDFINRGSTIPSRKEYADYLAWAARYVQDKGIAVAYGEEVVALHQADTDTVQVHSRVVATGRLIVRYARNLIISPGGSPRIPRPLQTIHTHPRVFHTSSYLSSLETLLSTPRSLRIAVVGSGQSAAEVLLDLHSRLSTIPGSHTLDIIIRKGSLKPSDDSPFTNEIFNPESTDTVFDLTSPSNRNRIRLEYANTNYGVVNSRTLESLYEVIYDQKLDNAIHARTSHQAPLSKRTITIRNYSEILTADIIPPSSATNESAESISLTIQHTLSHQIYNKTYDFVFCATGYERKSWLRLLATSNIAKHFDLDPHAQDGVRLASESEWHSHGLEATDADVTFEFADGSPDEEHSRADAPSTGTSTPATSLDSFSPKPREPTTKLYISRAYRLLPRPSSGLDILKPRIYLQGVTEETHGLSDTLLSVMSVRAGEVVDDLCAHLAWDDDKDGGNEGHGDSRTG